MRNVTLILDDGSRFSGKSFGYEKPVAGEVVFNTAMTGYPESLTDPSYAGQLMTLTYPLVGNYGVPPFTIEPNGLATFMESEKIHAEAIIVSDYSSEYSKPYSSCSTGAALDCWASGMPVWKPISSAGCWACCACAGRPDWPSVPGVP